MPSILYASGNERILAVEPRRGGQNHFLKISGTYPFGLSFYEARPIPFATGGQRLAELPHGHVLTDHKFDGFRSLDTYLQSLNGGANYLNVPRLEHVTSVQSWNKPPVPQDAVREQEDVPYAVVSVVGTSNSPNAEEQRKRSVIFMNGGYIILADTAIEGHYSHESGQTHFIELKAEKQNPDRFRVSSLLPGIQDFPQRQFRWKLDLDLGDAGDAFAPVEAETNGNRNSLSDFEQAVQRWFDTLRMPGSRY